MAHEEKNTLQSGTDARRTDGLKIIGAGFGRTGTLSLKEALQLLGFGPCYHMLELFEHPQHIPYWEAAVHNEQVDWDAIFQGYQATVDWPSCTFYKHLLAAYPSAKVLLSVRDPEQWYESVKSTVYRVSSSTQASFAASPLFTIPPNVAAVQPVVNQLVWNDTFHNRFEEKEYAIAVFNQHNEEVKRSVPSEKLLVYQVKEGWEPLCAFLGVPVPDVPFPRLNDRGSFPIK
jgi:hypothetical protein